MNNSFLQSEGWAEFQKSLGRQVFQYNKEGIRAYIFRHDIPFGKNYLYIPHGPEIDFNAMAGGIKNPVHNFVRWLGDVAKEQKSIFVKAEPLIDSVAQVLAENPEPSRLGGSYRAGKFKKSKKQIQPSKTVVVDLELSDEELLRKMHHKTRYNIKVAERHNIHVDEDSDPEIFWKLLKKTTKRDKFHSHPKDYYENFLNYFKNTPEISAKMFIARYDKKAVAGAIVLLRGDTGYYLHGASNYEYRKFMAPYLLHWQAAQYLKQKGFKNYDFWGIDAKKWPGVTRFKLGWGGRTTEYPGSFDLTARWFWHKLYNFFQNIKAR